jgi:hypothetical protein
MALEIATQPRDLNADWPLDLDDARLGAAHLRLIKSLVKQTYLGRFLNKAAYIAWAATSTHGLDGSIALIDNQLWTTRFVGAIASKPDGRDWFKVKDDFRAFAINNLTQLGKLNSQNTSGLGNIYSIAKRRPLVRYVQVLSGTEFNSADASAAFPDSKPVDNDICIQLLVGVSSQSFIRTYAGAEWRDIDINVFSKAAAFASLSAQMVSAVSLDADRLRVRRQEIMGETNIHVVDPDGFGPDSLVLWFGPKEGVVSWDGEIAYGSLTVVNAIRYETLAGKTGGGGTAPDPDPVPPTDATILAALGTMGESYSSETRTYRNNAGSSAVSIQMLTNGNFSFGMDETGTGSPISGPFLSATSPGIGAQFEVKFDTGAGTGLTTNSPLGAWTPLNANIYLTLRANSDEGTSLSNISRNVTVSVRKITTPGTVVQKVVAMSARSQTLDFIEP